VGDATLDLIVAAGLAAETVHLRPAGDTRFDALAGGVGGQLAAQFFIVRDRMGAWADEAHLADQDVYELRQLIDAGGANEAADTRDARVVFQRLLHLIATLGDAHRAELEDHECVAVEAPSGLAIDHRSARLDDDGERNSGKQRGEDKKRERGKHQVECALEQER
jgi:hypothetical protein